MNLIQKNNSDKKSKTKLNEDIIVDNYEENNINNNIINKRMMNIDIEQNLIRGNHQKLFCLRNK